MTPARTRVLSIVGPGRSGTTILGNILGEVEGVTNAGELRWLWRRGLLERRPCGCGLPPAQCPRWSAVLDRVWQQRSLDARADAPAAIGSVLSAQREVLLRRNRVRAIASARQRDTTWEALRCMRDVTALLCTSLAEVTESRLNVETSKLAQLSAPLAGADEIDHYVLHIVRDPRAVAFSWRRPKPLPVSSGHTTMATQGTRTSVGFWTENCVGAEMLRRRVPPHRWLFLRYEDFVANPRPHVERVLDFVSVPADGPFVTGDTVRLGTNHTLAGNPNRFRTGLVRISDDDEWRSRMSPRDQRVIAAATLPFLLRYGYPVRPARTGAVTRARSGPPA
jgi:hypothetical protein